MSVLSGLKIDHKAKHGQTGQDPCRGFCRRRVGPKKVMGDQHIGETGQKGRKKATGQMPWDKKGQQNAYAEKKVVEQEGIKFIGPKELKRQTDQKRPTARFLVVGNPVGKIFPIFKGAVITIAGLVGEGDILTHIGVDILIIVDAVGPGGHKEGHGKGKAEKGQEKHTFQVPKSLDQFHKVPKTDEDGRENEKEVDFQTPGNPPFEKSGYFSL
jgi:hypothetical protein